MITRKPGARVSTGARSGSKVAGACTSVRIAGVTTYRRGQAGTGDDLGGKSIITSINRGINRVISGFCVHCVQTVVWRGPVFWGYGRCGRCGRKYLEKFRKGDSITYSGVTDLLRRGGDYHGWFDHRAAQGPQCSVAGQHHVPSRRLSGRDLVGRGVCY